MQVTTLTPPLSPSAAWNGQLIKQPRIILKASLLTCREREKSANGGRCNTTANTRHSPPVRPPCPCLHNIITKTARPPLILATMAVGRRGGVWALGGLTLIEPIVPPGLMRVADLCRPWCRLRAIDVSFLSSSALFVCLVSQQQPRSQDEMGVRPRWL